MALGMAWRRIAACKASSDGSSCFQREQCCDIDKEPPMLSLLLLLSPSPATRWHQVSYSPHGSAVHCFGKDLADSADSRELRTSD